MQLMVEPGGSQSGKCLRTSGALERPRLLENDGGGGEGGAAGAAIRTNGGEGGGRYTVPLGVVLSSVTLSFSSLFGGQAGRGQGESPRAAGGLLEGAADGERGRTVYNIVMIQ